MMEELGRKTLSDADCKHVLSDNPRSGDDNQILIPKEIYENLEWDWSIGPHEVEIILTKENLVNALKFARVYGMSALFHKGERSLLDDKWYEDQLQIIETHFDTSDTAIYVFNIILSTQNRHYINGLTQESRLNLQEFLIPKYSSLVFRKEADKVFLEIDQNQKNLRGFCFNVFKILFKEFGDEFLKNNAEKVKTKIGQFDYTGVIFKSYFGSSKLLGVFESGRANEVTESGNRFRYQNEPFHISFLDHEVYFSTEFEYTRSNDSNIIFDNFKRFIEDYSEKKYSISKDKYGNYQLRLKSTKSDRKFLFSVEKSLREFAFRTFREVHSDFGDEFLDLKKSDFERTHNKYQIKAIGFQDYFGTKKIFAVFDSEQTKESLKTGTSIRYNPLDLSIMGEEFIYFSGQWSHPYDKSHPYFDEFVKFINDYGQGSYEIEYDPEEKRYSLFKLSDKKSTKDMKPIQKIFFGPPGTGKSHHIRKKYGKDLPRVTFHPELDYQGFIGAYKPTMVGDKITYKFMEEAFLRAYCKAWNSEEPYYLVIEEINRGNCAQIFGDIFQLLDRNESGFSEYPIICSPDVQQYLKSELGGISRFQEYEKATNSDDFSRMSLPNNLNILCTMNTSDQSLFPMDSAFKRRWDWQYIPINYKDAKAFSIDLGDGNEYNWGAFIFAINKRIKDHTRSEDKEIGNRFVSSGNGKISAEQFVSKVVFYLWSEIYKDEQGTGESIFFTKKDSEITFSDFFDDDGIDKDTTQKFIEYILPKKVEEAKTEADSEEIDEKSDEE